MKKTVYQILGLAWCAALAAGAKMIAAAPLPAIEAPHILSDGLCWFALFLLQLAAPVVEIAAIAGAVVGIALLTGRGMLAFGRHVYSIRMV